MAISGLEQLRAKIRALPEAARADIRKAMEQSADEVVAMAKRLVPVDSGALRDSIGWTWGEPPKGSFALARSGPPGEAITIYAGSRDKELGGRDAFYVRWVEFGTVTATAHPFFFPSWRALRRRVKSRNSRAVSKAFKKVAAGGK
jgi:HK97 gp10 family phage protein